MKKWMFLLSMIWASVGFTQTFDDLLQNYIGTNKTGYLQPLPDLMSGSFHSGWNVGGKIDSGLYFRIGIITTCGFITNSLKSFDAKTEYPFEPETAVSAPTIVGSNEGVTVEGVNGTFYKFQGGISMNLFPIAVPQLSIGGLLGTEVSVRFLAYDFKGDFGKVSILGGSAKHDIGQYLNWNKWFWNGAYAFQSVKGGNYFDFRSHLIQTEAGRFLKRAYYYGSLGFQTAELDAHYKDDENQGGGEVQVNLKNDFPIFIGLGGGLKLGVLRLHAAVNYAKVPFGEFGCLLQF